MIKLGAFNKIQNVYHEAQHAIQRFVNGNEIPKDSTRYWTEVKETLVEDVRREFIENRNTLPEELMVRYLKTIWYYSNQFSEHYNDLMEYLEQLSFRYKEEPYLYVIMEALSSGNLALIITQDEVQRYNRMMEVSFNSPAAKNEANIEPIALTEKCKINEIPTIFYNFLQDQKIKSSKANLVRVMMHILRDKDGNKLKKSTLDDIFNDSKLFSKSAKQR